MASIFKSVLLSTFVSYSILASELQIDHLTPFSQYVKSLETLNPDGLYPHQQDCLRAIDRDIGQYPYGFVEMATGTGKTRTFSVLIRELDLKTLIVVPTIVLIDQTAQTMEKSVPGKSISIFDGKHKDISGDILITTYASFRGEQNVDRFLGRGLVILDEVHYALSETNIASVNRLKSSSIPLKILGFTATGEFNTYRAEESFARVEELLPHLFFKYDIVSGLRNGILSQYRIIELDLHNPDLLQALRSKKPQGEETTAQWKERVLEALNNNAINRVFPNLIQTFEEGSLQSQTGLIFTVSIDHADALSSRLNKVFGQGYARSIHSKTKKTQARDMIEKHKTGEIKILVNVGVLTAGYDNPDLGFIIDFKPTGSQVSLVQAFGRLLRTGKTPVVKTYIQLVVPELDHLKASDIFAKEHIFQEISPQKAVLASDSSFAKKRSNDQMDKSNFVFEPRSLKARSSLKNKYIFATSESKKAVFMPGLDLYQQESHDEVEVFVPIIDGDVFADDSCGYTLIMPSGEQKRVVMESVDPEEVARIEAQIQEAIEVIDYGWPEDQDELKYKEDEKNAIDKMIEISKSESASLDQKRRIIECLSTMFGREKETIELWIEVMKCPKYVYQDEDCQKVEFLLRKYCGKNVIRKGPQMQENEKIYQQLMSDYERVKNANSVLTANF